MEDMDVGLHVVQLEDGSFVKLKDVQGESWSPVAAPAFSMFREPPAGSQRLYRTDAGQYILAVFKDGEPTEMCHAQRLSKLWACCWFIANGCQQLMPDELKPIAALLAD